MHALEHALASRLLRIAGAQKIEAGYNLRSIMKYIVAFAVALSLPSINLCLAQGQEARKQVPSADVVVKPVLSSSTTSAGDPIDLPQKDVQLIVSTYEIAPGAVLPIHKHPFPRYGYVLEGTLRVTNVETGRTESFRTGDFILEAVGRWHRGGNDGDRTTKLLVIDVVEKGSSNSITKE